MRRGQEPRGGVLVRLLALAIAAVCASRAAVKSTVSCRMASKVMAGVSDVDVLLGGILSTKDNTYGMIHGDGDNDANDGDGDERDISWFYEISSLGIEKYRGLNSSDGGNIGDRVKIAGGVIRSGDEIVKRNDPDEDGK
ncbi:hypothetical protein Tco_0775218 [Tanacetum coccineum]